MGECKLKQGTGRNVHPLASANDLLNGAIHNPKLYRALCHIELESGFTFKLDRPLFRVAPDLLTPGQRQRGLDFIPHAQRAMPRNVSTGVGPLQLSLFA
jgi:hypothetical protein